MENRFPDNNERLIIYDMIFCWVQMYYNDTTLVIIPIGDDLKENNVDLDH